MRFRVRPKLVHLSRIAAEADAVDSPVRRENADGDGNIVGLSLGINRLFKEKRFAIFFFDAAAKLPAHQRMHLLIFVHRFLDADQ